MKHIVITGASTGIGRAATKALTDKGFHVFGSVRKIEDASSLTKEFGDKVTPLIFDVTDEAAVKVAAAQVKEALGDATLFGLVNNAGIAVSGPLMHIPIDDVRHQMEVNTIAPLIVTQAFLPLLGATNPPVKNPGRIINISSVAGKTSTPIVTPYAMSKHALEAFSEGLRRELMLYGIDVIGIAPGAVATPIWGKAEEVDISGYQDTDYKGPIDKIRDYMLSNGPKGIAPKRLGELIHHTLTTPKPKVRYTIVPNYLTDLLIPSLLPKRTLDKILAGRLGLKKLGS